MFCTFTTTSLCLLVGPPPTVFLLLLLLLLCSSRLTCHFPLPPPLTPSTPCPVSVTHPGDHTGLACVSARVCMFQNSWHAYVSPGDLPSLIGVKLEQAVEYGCRSPTTDFSFRCYAGFPSIFLVKSI